jgi:hypothetical protein
MAEKDIGLLSYFFPVVFEMRRFFSKNGLKRREAMRKIRIRKNAMKQPTKKRHWALLFLSFLLNKTKRNLLRGSPTGLGLGFLSCHVDSATDMA